MKQCCNIFAGTCLFTPQYHISTAHNVKDVLAVVRVLALPGSRTKESWLAHKNNRTYRRDIVSPANPLNGDHSVPCLHN